VAPRWGAYSSSRCSCRQVFVPSTPSLSVFRSATSHFIRVCVSHSVKQILLRSPAYTLQQCSAPAESVQGADNTNFACLQNLHSSLAAHTRAMQSRDAAQAECKSTLSLQGGVRLLLQLGPSAAPRLPLATVRRAATGGNSPDAEKAQRSAAAAALTGPSSSLANATHPAARTAAHGSGRPARRTGPRASLRRAAAALAHSFGGGGGRGGGVGAAGPSGGGVDSAARERAVAAAADAARRGLHDLGAAFGGIAVAIGGRGDGGGGGGGGGATGAAGGGGNGQAEAETSAAAPAAVAIGGGESPAESLAFVGALALQVRFVEKCNIKINSFFTSHMISCTRDGFHFVSRRRSGTGLEPTLPLILL